jgi:hypothetical protein
LPNQLSFQIQFDPPASTSSFSRVSAYVDVANRSVGVVR